MVDEYQDLNRLEQEFIDAIAKVSKLLVVVGDPDQSIYSFKFAHPDGIRGFGDRADVQTHKGLTTWRCPKAVVTYANQLLQQADPGRTAFLDTPDGAGDGEVVFVTKTNQDGEFQHVLSDISQRLSAGAAAKDIIVLVPRKKLGSEFVKYANANKTAAGIGAATDFCLSLKPDFTALEKERLLLLGLVAKPDSLLHIRAYIGLPDATHFAKELHALKTEHGNLGAVMQKASAAAIPAKKVRLKQLATRVERLRAFIKAHEDSTSVNGAVDELFPDGEPEVAAVRSVLVALIEPTDTLVSLYGKFVDYMRTIPHQDTQVRVMTLMASKGLEADHVYILGCNAGNIPGENRSAHLSDLQHRQEQLRLLYVGFTRARKSLIVSWSQYLSFAQSKKHHTPSVGTVTYAGKPVSKVGICEFLQDLKDVTWQ